MVGRSSCENVNTNEGGADSAEAAREGGWRGPSSLEGARTRPRDARCARAGCVVIQIGRSALLSIALTLTGSGSLARFDMHPRVSDLASLPQH